jgi:hypothetical protein
MDLLPYVAQVHRQLVVAAEAGGPEAVEVAERLAAPLESTTRLVLLDALTEAATEITEGLAPASVEVRLRGRDVAFAVSPATSGSPAAPAPATSAPASSVPADEDPGDEGGTARLSLRLPERLKPRVEKAAEDAGLSVNAWLVRSITAVLDDRPSRSAPTPPPLHGQSHSGWVH